MEPLDALLREEQIVLATFSPPNAKPSQIADLVANQMKSGLAVDVSIEESVESAPEIAQAITTAASFPLAPYLALIAARVRLQEVMKDRRYDILLPDFQRTVKRRQEEVNRLAASIGKKYGITIPGNVVETYLLGLSERVRQGVFDDIGLPSFLRTGQHYGKTTGK